MIPFWSQKALWDKRLTLTWVNSHLSVPSGNGKRHSASFQVGFKSEAGWPTVASSSLPWALSQINSGYCQMLTSPDQLTPATWDNPSSNKPLKLVPVSSSFRQLRRSNTNHQGTQAVPRPSTTGNNLAPSGVNKTLDGSTCPRWKIGRYSQIFSFFLFKMQQAISETNAAIYKLMELC